MTRGERVVNGTVLHEVLAYRWDLYQITTDSRRAYESGLGEWTVGYLDPTTLTVSYVDKWWSLADALQGAKAHRQMLADRVGVSDV